MIFHATSREFSRCRAATAELSRAMSREDYSWVRATKKTEVLRDLSFVASHVVLTQTAHG
jgi:hypothetical protein